MRILKKGFFNRCDTFTLRYISNEYKTEGLIDSLFKYYQAEVDLIYKEYQKVEVPRILPYNNIQTSGHNDGYIEFCLLRRKDDKSDYLFRCYLLVDSSVLGKKDSIFLSKLPRFDDKWYFYLIVDK